MLLFRLSKFITRRRTMNVFMQVIATALVLAHGAYAVASRRRPPIFCRRKAGAAGRDAVNRDGAI
jgi:hypothetical protein